LKYENQLRLISGFYFNHFNQHNSFTNLNLNGKF